VTSRGVAAERETRAEFAEFGIAFTALYFLPEISVAKAICPHDNLDWRYQRYLWHKIEYALRYRLSDFVDDDPKVAALFRRFAGGMAFVPAHARKAGLSTILGLVPAGKDTSRGEV